MRLALPLDAARRFVSQANGIFLDGLTEQRFAAALFPDSAENRRMAWHLAYLRHPMLVPVVRIFVRDQKIVLLSPILPTDEAVTSHWPTAYVNDAAAGFLHLSMVLRQLGLEPGWRRRHLIWRDGQMRCFLPDSSVDPAYQLPHESLHPFLEGTSIYAVGAFLLHFFNQVYHRPGEFRDPCLLIRRLRPVWRELLQRMVDMDIHLRPTFEEALAQAAIWCKEDFVTHIRQRVFFGFQEDWTQASPLLLPQDQRFAFVEKLPGRERMCRILPWIAQQEAIGDWVVHLWFPAPMGRRYGVLNLLSIRLSQLLEQHGFEAPKALIEPLLDWSEPQAVTAQVEQLLSFVAETLVGQHCQRMWWLIEDFEHLDTGSGQILLDLVKSATHTWLGIVFTGLHGVQLRLHGCLDRVPVLPLVRLDGSRMPQIAPGWCENQARSVDLRLEHGLLGAAEVGLLDGFAPLWQTLEPREQLLFKLAALMPGKLDLSLVERAFELRGLNAVFARMAQLQWFVGSVTGFTLADVGCREMVMEKLDASERATLLRTLFAHFPADDAHLLQRAFLAFQLELDDALTASLERVYALIETEGRFAYLWEVMAWPKSTQVAPFSELLQAAQVLAGKVPKLTTQPFAGVIKMLHKGHTLRNRGDYRKALEVYQTLAGMRYIALVWKAEALMQMAFCAFLGDINLVVPGVIRRFSRMKRFAEDFSQQRYDEWVAMLAGFQPEQELRGEVREAEAKLAAPMRAWVDAQRNLHGGAFIDAARNLRSAADWLAEHPNLRLRALFYKHRGIAAYRQNRVADARDYFMNSKRLYMETGDTVGVANARFNLASAEFLAGSLVQAQARFQQMLDEAVEPLLQCQLHYYLAACTQLRGLRTAFEQHATQHLKLAKRLDEVEEQCKNYILRLWQPSLLQSETLKQILQTLDRLLKKHDFSDLLRQEAALARYFSCWGLGLAVNDWPEPEVNGLTHWRLQLIEVLRGAEKPSFGELVADIGEDYFAALHTLMLSEAVVMQRLSSTMKASLPKDFFKVKGHRFGAHYPRSAYRTASSTKVDESAETWRQCLAAFELIPDSGSFNEQQRRQLFSHFAQVWPFQTYGLAQQQQGQWLVDGDPAMQADVVASLTYLKDQQEQPLQMLCVPSSDKEPHTLLCFQLRQQPHTLLWLVASETDQARPSETLLSVYHKLFRLACAGLLKTLKQRPKDTAHDRLPQYGMIGNGRSMQAVRQKITAFAPSDLNIYIWGASGTGKELTARAFHDASERVQAPFRAINCSHYTENLVASELFGHVRGAFTGAQANKAGLLDLVDGGTLFLDEVGDLSAKIQSLLLRVVQEGEFTRVGDTKVRHVNIRFICATNKSLHRLIDAGTFREDLFFRLVGEEVHLPALTARFEDLPELVRYFVAKYGVSERGCSFSSCFYEKLRSYHWPGNVRELESYVRKMLVEHPEVTFFEAHHCPNFLRPKLPEKVEVESTNVVVLKDFIERQELDFVVARLKKLGGNRSRTAESLGISRQKLGKVLQRQADKD